MMEQFYIVHDLNSIARAKCYHVWLVEVLIHGTDYVGCAGQRGVDHRVVGIFKDYWRAFHRNDNLSERLQVFDVLVNVVIAELIKSPEAGIPHHTLYLVDEEGGQDQHAVAPLDDFQKFPSWPAGSGVGADEDGRIESDSHTPAMIRQSGVNGYSR
jgi:hypothetical protein